MNCVIESRWHYWRIDTVTVTVATQRSFVGVTTSIIVEVKARLKFTLELAMKVLSGRRSSSMLYFANFSLNR